MLQLCFWAAVLLYVIPVSALQAVLQVRRLEKVPVIRALVNISVVRRWGGKVLQCHVLVLHVLTGYVV